MHRVLVEERRWVDETRFLHALNFCMLLPGPEAQQLATYVGWLLHGTRGGVAAGTLFVLPGSLAVLALSALYAELREVGAVAALFFGLKPAVLAVVVEALLRIARRALRGRLHVAVAAAAFVALFAFGVPFPLIVLGAGLFGALFRPAWPDALEPARATAAPAPGQALRALAFWGGLWALPIVLLLALNGRGQVFVDIALFFSRAAVVTFGGAYAVLAYIAQQAVDRYGWLQPGEMLDGLGLAETTPGPLILVTQFVGFLAAHRAPGALPPLLAGALGAALTTWVTFTPCFLWIFLAAPYVEALRGRRALSGALAAITAAVVGVIANLALWFALHVVFEVVTPLRAGPLSLLVPAPTSLRPAALALAVAALLAMLRFRVGMLPTLAASALAGAAWRHAGGA
jgi:chromate transporter